MHGKILDYLHEVAIAVPRVGSGKLAAAVVYKGRIVSVGINQMKTHPLQLKYQSSPLKSSLHAEIAAIIRCSRILNEREISRASICVARDKKVLGVHSYGLARPCTGCLDCIIAFGFKDIWYTNDAGSFQPYDQIKLT